METVLSLSLSLSLSLPSVSCSARMPQSEEEGSGEDLVWSVALPKEAKGSLAATQKKAGGG